MMKLISKDLIGGLCMLAIALFLITVLIPAGIVEPRRIKYAALSPSYYPRIISWALLVLGACVSLRALMKPAAVVIDTTRRSDATRQISKIMALLLAFTVALPTLGFPLTSSLALLIAFPIAGERRWGLIIALSVLVPLGLYLFFLKVAGIPIPLGILQPWLGGV